MPSVQGVHRDKRWRGRIELNRWITVFAWRRLVPLLTKADSTTEDADLSW